MDDRLRRPRVDPDRVVNYLLLKFTDPAKKDENVKLGAFAQIAAKRRFGLDAVKSEDPEPVLFGCYVELEGPAAAALEGAFDTWLQGLESFELVTSEEPDADPSPAETSTASSPASPPTSDSTPAE